jgi:hypothetical protein
LTRIKVRRARLLQSKRWRCEWRAAETGDSIDETRPLALRASPMSAPSRAPARCSLPIALEVPAACRGPVAIDPPSRHPSQPAPVAHGHRLRGNGAAAGTPLISACCRSRR